MRVTALSLQSRMSFSILLVLGHSDALALSLGLLEIGMPVVQCCLGTLCPLSHERHLESSGFWMASGLGVVLGLAHPVAVAALHQPSVQLSVVSGDAMQQLHCPSLAMCVVHVIPKPCGRLRDVSDDSGAGLSSVSPRRALESGSLPIWHA